jgi:hypothetical protein
VCDPRLLLVVRLSTPVSLLLSSVIIALGLYFGLRTPSANVPPPAPSPAPALVPTPVPPAPSVPPVPTEAQTAAQVTDLVVRVHPSWKAACWDSADPATRKPGRYTATLAFDATGKLVIFGITEHREQTDPAVAQCMRTRPIMLPISAPGRAVTYEVPFQMP